MYANIAVRLIAFDCTCVLELSIRYTIADKKVKMINSLWVQLWNNICSRPTWQLTSTWCFL